MKRFAIIFALLAVVRICTAQDGCRKDSDCTVHEKFMRLAIKVSEENVRHAEGLSEP